MVVLSSQLDIWLYFDGSTPFCFSLCRTNADILGIYFSLPLARHNFGVRNLCESLFFENTSYSVGDLVTLTRKKNMVTIANMNSLKHYLYFIERKCSDVLDLKFLIKMILEKISEATWWCFLSHLAVCLCLRSRHFYKMGEMGLMYWGCSRGNMIWWHFRDLMC